LYCTAIQGVILYGEPGTGKTLLAKAVANSTSATFLRVVGSELIQKYLGDGPKLVRELFRAADELSPSIVFIGDSLFIISLFYVYSLLRPCRPESPF
jgi:ATP-dependent 26S proteasome regulatory subunit